MRTYSMKLLDVFHEVFGGPITERSEENSNELDLFLEMLSPFWVRLVSVIVEGNLLSPPGVNHLKKCLWLIAFRTTVL
jgi:hypothetical protein